MHKNTHKKTNSRHTEVWFVASEDDGDDDGKTVVQL